MSFIMSPELQVDFHTGTQGNSDIAFSFRVYFGNCVVMNSRQFGDWKSEEKYEGMPFVDGQPFELCISVLQNEYQTWIKNQRVKWRKQLLQSQPSVALEAPNQTISAKKEVTPMLITMNSLRLLISRNLEGLVQNASWDSQPHDLQ